MMLEKKDSLLVGIDVSKATLDVARSDVHEVCTFANDEAGIAQLVKMLKPMSPTMIVVEATGGLEQAVIDALLDAACAVAGSIPGKCVTSPKPLGLRPRPIRLMLACWLNLSVMRRRVWSKNARKQA